MPTATLRFHGSLNDFLPASRRNAPIACEFESPPGIRDVIQALNVPHPEVDLIVAGGRSVDFGYRLASGDRVEVYGLDRTPPIDPPAADGLVPPAPAPCRFVLDGHLGRLARYLRMLGFDARYHNRAGDAELARISAAEDRVLLTRDRGLLKRSIVRLGYLIRDDDPRRQLAEVIARYRLAPFARPFTRCVRCNGLLEQVDRAAVAERLAGEPRTLRFFDTFGRCVDCGSIYWQGSHFDRMSRLAQEMLHPAPPIGENQAQSQVPRRRR